MNRSLCCDAPINEQFSICTDPDCGEHAELSGPSRNGAAFDADGVNTLLQQEERVSTAPYMVREFPRPVDVAKEAAAALAIFVGLAIFWGLS